jgi:hypothetical protein
MKYAFELDDSSGICTVRVTGEFHSPQDSVALQRLSVQVYTEHKCHLFLYDMTQAEIFTGTMQAYDTASPQGELARGLQKLRGAILYSRLTDHERFLETVAVNRNFAIRVFDDHERTIEWLKQG